MNGIVGHLPSGVLVSWYGDDFTGASAVMEAMTFSGLPSVLFVDVPTAGRLAAFPGCRGIGIAGVARAKSPTWMERELPPVFNALDAIGAPIAHYKICSTLDSSPNIGSIGRAIDLGVPILGGAWHPMVVAAPAIARYQAFGNLFAALDGTSFRLDRHPTVSRHPTTPMHEADIRRHLAHQTTRPIGLDDLVALRSARPDSALTSVRRSGAEVVAFDSVDEGDLAEVGRLVWENRGPRLFAIGSQGLEYALIAHWRRTGLLEPVAISPTVEAVERLAVVSGSCSMQTAGQIAFAFEHGFEQVRVDVTKAVDDSAWSTEIERAIGVMLEALSTGRNPIAFTALGPDDPSVSAFKTVLSMARANPEIVNERIGRGLGSILDRVVGAARIKRVAIAGGDTSGNGVIALGVHALTALAPTVAGAALFRAHCDDPTRDGLEIALKGGQMGASDYFVRLKDGASNVA